MVNKRSLAEFGVLSNFSFLKGGSHPEEYVKQAIKLDLSGLAITDENSVAGVVKAYSAISSLSKNKSSLLKLIFGARIITKDNFSITTIVKNLKGWKNLCRILTTITSTNYNDIRHPSLQRIISLRGGLIFLIHPPEESEDPLILKNWIRSTQKLSKNLSNSYMILSPKYDSLDSTRFRNIARLSSIFKLKLVASCMPIMHDKSRQNLIDVLSAIRNKCTVKELGTKATLNGEQYLRGPLELERIFQKYQSALENNQKILLECNFSLSELKYEYPSEIIKNQSPQRRLVNLTANGLKFRYPQKIPSKIQSQVNRELQLIKKLNYAPYFLTVYDIVAFAKSRAILYQGRGSAANSVVCYALGITAVSPEIGTMVFERFISEARNEPPDIDVDFEHERREEIIQYIYKKFGRYKAGICATVIHYKKRQALREVSKVMGLSKDLSNTIITQYNLGNIEYTKGSYRQKLSTKTASPQINKILILASEIYGFPRHLGQHTGGFIITNQRLDELIPIQAARMKNRTMVCWDKEDIAVLGILKIDILGLGILTCIRKAFSLINDIYGLQYSLSTIPKEEPQVYEMLCKADSIGIFQVESRAQMNFLPRMLPRCFYDLVIQIAIIRPGPIQGDMVHPYLRRRQGIEKITLPSNELGSVLGKTLGVPLFQEQVMKIAIVAADFSAEEADQLRKAFSKFRKEGEIQTFKKRFILGMLYNGYTNEFAERCFSQIEGFGEYGFPESHAASFALLVYASAWIKAYYPEIFTCALLNSQPMGFYKPYQIIQDAERHGVKIYPISANHSSWDHKIEKRSSHNIGLRLGLRLIKGFLRVDAVIIEEKRKRSYATIKTFWNKTKVNYATMVLLAKADCFACMNKNRHEALWEIYALNSSKKMPLIDKNEKPNKATKLPSLSAGKQVKKDLKTFGLTLRDHPLKLLRPILDKI